VLLGADSPIPPKHGIATAALIPGASHRIEPEAGISPGSNTPDRSARRWTPSAANRQWPSVTPITQIWRRDSGVKMPL
jgi:hypothetical protein